MYYTKICISFFLISFLLIHILAFYWQTTKKSKKKKMKMKYHTKLHEKEIKKEIHLYKFKYLQSCSINIFPLFPIFQSISSHCYYYVTTMTRFSLLGEDGGSPPTSQKCANFPPTKKIPLAKFLSPITKSQFPQLNNNFQVINQ